MKTRTIPSASPAFALDRRSFLRGTTAVGTVAAAASVGISQVTAQEAGDNSVFKFRHCLNTSTIRDHKLPLAKSIGLIAKAGYAGIEPWIGELDRHQKEGGSLEDLGKMIADLGLTVESAIGFANWIVDDDVKRAAGLEQAKRDMEKVRKIGGLRIAAPPVGATDQTDLNLFKAAERYRALLKAAESIGVIPQVELWGFSKSLSRIGELAFVAAESGHPDACVLTDVYHIYKGGSSFEALKTIAGQKMHVMHINDYPDIERNKIGDKDRVFPGDGVAPLKTILSGLIDNGFGGVLSLELFNKEYGKLPVETVLATGLAKTKAAVAAAMGV
ncbi:MAG: 2-keto-myo-inositol isomerase [Verrucomicrobiales bacterium]|jgi:2-keto-myo-inositol isomerase